MSKFFGQVIPFNPIVGPAPSPAASVGVVATIDLVSGAAPAPAASVGAVADNSAIGVGDHPAPSSFAGVVEQIDAGDGRIFDPTVRAWELLSTGTPQSRSSSGIPKARTVEIL